MEDLIILGEENENINDYIEDYRGDSFLNSDENNNRISNDISNIDNTGNDSGIINNVIDKREIEEEEINTNESKQVNQSDIIIFGSNDYNNLRSNQSVDLDNYNQTILWSNSNPNLSFGNVIVPLSENIDDFDLIGIEYKYSIDYDLRTIYIIKVNDFKLLTNNYLGLCAYYNGNYFRFCGYNPNGVLFDNCVKYQTQTVGNGYCIPLNIYGYKAITLSNNDIPNQIVSGNNIYNFNYYCNGVSDNAVSSNIMEKPISEYNVQESLSFFGITLALIVGLVIIIRKGLYKWN